MKKLFGILLVLVLLTGLLATAALAAPAEGTVCVTIAVDGEIVTGADGAKVANAPVKVSDLDGDGSFNVDEVLVAAHNAFYPGGAEAGYASSVGDWGPTIDMLWGDTSYAFGYYVNDAMAWGLGDPVEDGGSVKAYVYADKEYYSDVYSYFDKASAEGDSVALTLYAGSFDENWNVVFAPAAGAKITVDGVKTGVVTDADGKATVSFSEPGTHLVSAVSDETIYVPAVCCVTVPQAAPSLISPAPSAQRSHTVAPGDCLWKIAQKYFGTGSKWDAIYQANASIIKNPNLIYAGQVLVIPD